jgi:O-acetyl-ADP-ribose deacetylase (regulator of RNase III)
LEECRQIRNRQGGCKAGEAVITRGGKLKVKHVIHTVGPVWNGGNSNEEQLLANAYRNSLQLAVENNINTIAFPNISTGVYGFPKRRAAEIAIDTVEQFLQDNESIREVVFCCFDEENTSLYKQLLK